MLVDIWLELSLAKIRSQNIMLSGCLVLPIGRKSAGLSSGTSSPETSGVLAAASPSGELPMSWADSMSTSSVLRGCSSSVSLPIAERTAGMSPCPGFGLQLAFRTTAHRAPALHAFSRLVSSRRHLLIRKIFATTFLAKKEDEKFLTIAFRPRIRPDVGKKSASTMSNSVRGHLSPGMDCTVAMCAPKFPT
jgi:hypothetical protein